mmetsp:Transcript_85334/g.275394  ORF Transcript_85334/g.275394 Transcript_85334/m.275394 type:complete len:603 (-) Transcript_85334:54-1862(-)|eukprot:CAMPEP_0203930394 /NCGR_PEP_ID=MMETSP0359-20131031/69152_1 /ASSEMBLY_ACC=CAM_ASM_000338 /TAXON_ID=268821 /ORGANISM="Scrippsiella Hangoei, Strain SHTV-5" /LENGTH=602 /DNA_ID=CAMNT_0050859569 /DNA_START=110 /DNA_END=1918 /DNA_ORIENTATION=-
MAPDTSSPSRRRGRLRVPWAAPRPLPRCVSSSSSSASVPAVAALVGVVVGAAASLVALLPLLGVAVPLHRLPAAWIAPASTQLGAKLQAKGAADASGRVPRQRLAARPIYISKRMEEMLDAENLKAALLQEKWQANAGAKKRSEKVVEGRRLAQIVYVRETMEKVWKAEEEEYAGMDFSKQRPEIRAGKKEIIRLEKAGLGPAARQQSMTISLIGLVPQIVSARASGEPMDEEELVYFFGTCEEKYGGDLKPMLVEAYQKMEYVSEGLGTMSLLFRSMAKAKLQSGPAYETLAKNAFPLCKKASPVEIADFGRALASACQLDADTKASITKGLSVSKNAYFTPEPEMIRILAWNCGEAGLRLPEVFGDPHHTVVPEVAVEAWNSVARLASLPQGQLVSGAPVPIVAVEEVVTEEEAQGLIDLADKEKLWQPSARIGKKPVSGRPWSALFGNSSHRTHPAIVNIRLWAADAFDVPVSQVEAVRLVRWRVGEATPTPHADTKPAGDTSMWARGQRIATVLINLKTLPDEAGGDTVFQIKTGDLCIPPDVGTALVWPVVDTAGRPSLAATRSSREVLDAGVWKYSAVTWVRSQKPPDWYKDGMRL